MVGSCLAVCASDGCGVSFSHSASVGCSVSGNSYRWCHISLSVRWRMSVVRAGVIYILYVKNRQQFRSACSECAAVRLHGTVGAVRRNRQAMQRTELHDSRVEHTRVITVEQFFRQLTEQVLAGGGVESRVTVVQPRQNTIDVAVKGRIGHIVGKRGDSARRVLGGDSARRVLAYAGQGTQLGKRLRKEDSRGLSSVSRRRSVICQRSGLIFHNHLGCLVQVAGAGVIS